MLSTIWTSIQFLFLLLFFAVAILLFRWWGAAIVGAFLIYLVWGVFTSESVKQANKRLHDARKALREAEAQGRRVEELQEDQRREYEERQKRIDAADAAGQAARRAAEAARLAREAEQRKAAG